MTFKEFLYFALKAIATAVIGALTVKQLKSWGVI